MKGFWKHFVCVLLAAALLVAGQACKKKDDRLPISYRCDKYSYEQIDTAPGPPGTSQRITQNFIGSATLTVLLRGDTVYIDQELYTLYGTSSGVYTYHSQKNYFFYAYLYANNDSIVKVDLNHMAAFTDNYNGYKYYGHRLR